MHFFQHLGRHKHIKSHTLKWRDSCHAESPPHLSCMLYHLQVTFLKLFASDTQNRMTEKVNNAHLSEFANA